MEVRRYMRGGVRVITSDRRWRILVSEGMWRDLRRKARVNGYSSPLEMLLGQFRGGFKKGGEA